MKIKIIFYHRPGELAADIALPGHLRQASKPGKQVIFRLTINWTLFLDLGYLRRPKESI